MCSIGAGVGLAHQKLFLRLSGDNPENDAARIMKLLKDGAHAFANDNNAEADGAGEEKGMAQENIDQVKYW